MMENYKRWTQLRCPICGKRLLDVMGSYTLAIPCRHCKKTITFRSAIDKPETVELPSK